MTASPRDRFTRVNFGDGPVVANGGSSLIPRPECAEPACGVTTGTRVERDGDRLAGSIVNLGADRRVTLARIIECFCAVLLLGSVRTLPSDTRLAPDGASLPAQAAASEADRAVAALDLAVGDRRNEPARTVFKNLQILGDVPAGRIAAIMRVGYSRSLGVSCDHCHDAADWSSDKIPAKRTARAMARMTRDLAGMLGSMAELGGRPTIVNCTTCHRGQRVPATDLPQAPAGRGR